MVLYVYFFNISKNDVILNLLFQSEEHMSPIAMMKASQIQNVIQISINHLNSISHYYTLIGNGSLTQTNPDQARKWYWNRNVVQENFSGFKKYMTQVSPQRWESILNSSWSWNNNKEYLRFQDLPSLEKQVLSMASTTDTIIQPIYKSSKGQYTLIYSIFSDGIISEYPYITYQPEEENPLLLQPYPIQVKDFSSKQNKLRNQVKVDDSIKDSKDIYNDNKKRPTLQALDCQNLNSLSDYEPRCSSYYINAQENPEKTVFSSPYIDILLNNVCITLSKFFKLNKSVEGVVAMDLDMNWLNNVSILDYKYRGQDMLIAICPINLILDSDTNKTEHVFSIGIAMKSDDVTTQIKSLTIISDRVITILCILGALVILTLITAAIVAYETSHYIIRPLRMLNSKMREIINAKQEIELINEEETSKELTDLYDVFKNLISAKKFENNDFIQKSDALAVIDLAEACNMFDCQNYKAAGICYNNIANIQFKNEKYSQAAENFFNAIEQAMICLKLKTPQEVYARQDRTLSREQYSNLIDPETPSLEQKIYYEKVFAHRTYQYSMCLYKELRYKNSSLNDPNLTWNKVDAWLRQSIQRYQGIKQDDSAQPLFIDLIKKITISRAYSNIHNNKLLTAEKLLDCAQLMISFIEKGRLHIITEEREEAPVIPIEILRQKYLMHAGLLYTALNQDKVAAGMFTRCLRSGQIYDPRIRRECVLQLQLIFERHNQYSPSLDKMIESFNHKNKDVVFLVNVEQSMEPHTLKFQAHLDYIFEKGLEQRDRISLITCSKNCRRLFSLVHKEKNYVQLKNLITRIKTNQQTIPCLLKGVKEAVKEFLDQDHEFFQDRNKLIICMTNHLSEADLQEDYFNDIEYLLNEFECTLIVFGYGLNNKEKKYFRKLCLSTQEGRLLIDPDLYQIEELFISLSNYKFESNKTFILETFN
ncbi:UNKNOWN [Stylonychia lemnae]|uniref:VWFA domain-containing protein n=1 Tax=Stylonychia lemnae TaxID=5949 RepID=A0A078AMX4_STYLE|nr:UNKNOWN [Stylonychia lemnae]|eukprot:CDW83509.1 UNKNOWN [Stylonychia lemnae]